MEVPGHVFMYQGLQIRTQGSVGTYHHVSAYPCIGWNIPARISDDMICTVVPDLVLCPLQSRCFNIRRKICQNNLSMQ